ncbi:MULTISPECIES: LacI family DNA-binding transcriptional regulator [unclassified Asaia]|uniref:LacI family DNA-binding transcriptional regulator n=1 Tax=unclassified Asaia TaxID=2685023 RepID=UPI0018F2877B|nr:LacI family DNA-binding transcriptional regulator [Asaia sp. W19]
MTALVKMSDVARRANVAVSTVSHVVNNTRHVQPETRAAVEAAIAETGYVPNSLARQLARGGGQTNTIGVALAAVSNPYFIDLVGAIVRGLSARGKMVFLADTAEDPAREIEIIRSFHRRRVDGILLAPAGVSAPWPTLDYLARNKIPSVLVDRLIAPAFSQAGCDNALGITLLYDHLRRRGHERIALVAGQPLIASTTQRVAAFRACAQAADAPVTGLIVTGTSDVAAARRATCALLAAPKPPSAIMAGNNHAMIGVMQAIRDYGLTVPEQMAVVGFDDFEWADCFQPRLTVVRQPVEAIAEAALTLLDQAMETPAAPPQTRIFAPELVLRDSCGAPVKPFSPEGARVRQAHSGLVASSQDCSV